LSISDFDSVDSSHFVENLSARCIDLPVQTLLLDQILEQFWIRSGPVSSEGVSLVGDSGLVSLQAAELLVGQPSARSPEQFSGSHLLRLVH
jgi:hypothetical protein